MAVPVRAAPPEPTLAPRTYRQRVSVSFDYDVHFVRDLFAPEDPLFAEALPGTGGAPARLLVFVEDTVADAHPQLAARIAHYAAVHASKLSLVRAPVRVVGGEACKNDPSLIESLQRTMLDAKIDRHAYAAVIGGGALLDAVGFAAATFHRGVRHLRIPTTVLAQDDSGVGVKNGVNAFGLKNLIGTFAPPYAVFNDASFLRSLPARDRIAGLAEAVKVALIRDRAFFLWLEEHAASLRAGDEDAMAYAIRRCAELHMNQIANGGDPFERGSARPLDYGHWSAHKLEILTQHAIRHGEAVAIGIALDARYAVAIGLLPEGAELRILRTLERLGFTLWHDALLSRNARGDYSLIAGLEEFREHLGGELTITLLRELGTGVEVHTMDLPRVEEALHWLRDRRGTP